MTDEKLTTGAELLSWLVKLKPDQLALPVYVPSRHVDYDVCPVGSTKLELIDDEVSGDVKKVILLAEET